MSKKSKFGNPSEEKMGELNQVRSWLRSRVDNELYKSIEKQALSKETANGRVDEFIRLTKKIPFKDSWGVTYYYGQGHRPKKPEGFEGTREVPRLPEGSHLWHPSNIARREDAYDEAIKQVNANPLLEGMHESKRAWVRAYVDYHGSSWRPEKASPEFLSSKYKDINGNLVEHPGTVAQSSNLNVLKNSFYNPAIRDRLPPRTRMSIADILSDREEYRNLSQDSLKLVERLKEAGVSDVAELDKWEKVKRHRTGPDYWEFDRTGYLSGREIEEIFNPTDPFERAARFMQPLQTTESKIKRRQRPAPYIKSDAEKKIIEGRQRQAPYIKSEGLLKHYPASEIGKGPAMRSGILEADVEEMRQSPEERKRIRAKQISDIRTRLGLGSPSAYATGGTGRFLFGPKMR